VEPADLALVKYTSGSTGFPKGVLLEQWGLVTVGALHSRRIGMTSEDRFFSQMPFFHAGGSVWGLMTMLSQGGTLVFTETNDADTAVQLVDEEKCTAIMGVPPMFHAMLEVLAREPREIDTVKVSPFADARLTGQLNAKFGVEFGFMAYGMTEAYGPSAVTSPGDPEELRLGGWARPLEGQELRVVDPVSGVDVEPGVVGEIWMRGLVMRGYHNMPEQTAGTIDGDGWIHSQDLALMNEDGFIRYVGRLKAMLKVGGENVAVEEVENVIRLFEGVVEVCVIGVPDDRKGEAPRAYVLSGDPAGIDVDELGEWCRVRLARYKVPRDYVVVDQMPMTGSGKPDRAAIIRQDREAANLEHIQA
jgi:fatty-acyl-CoA synthase